MKLSKKWSLWGAFLNITLCWGVDTTQILLVSSSGRTVIMDQGIYAGFKVGETVKFVKVETKDMNVPKLQFAGKAINVKVSPDHSIWYFRELAQEVSLKKGMRLSYLKEEQVLQGRNLPNTKKKKVILNDRMDLQEILFQEKEKMPSDLILKGEDREGKEFVYDHEVNPGVSMENQGYDIWKKEKKTKYVNEYLEELEQKYLGPRSKTLDDQKIIDETKEMVFDKKIQGVIKKMNHLDFGLEGLYWEQRRDRDLPAIQQKISSISTYDSHYKEVEARHFLEPRAKAKFQKDGELWSADMNDEEMRNYMLETGIDEEKRRQKYNLEHKAGLEFSFKIGLGMSDHFTELDPSYQGRGYSIGLTFEYPFVKIAELLDRFSMEFFVMQGISYYEIADDVNGRFADGSYGGALNFYFLGVPHALDRLISYVGVGARRGLASVTSSLISQDYDYHIVGMPEYHLGVKYRFRSGDERNNSLNVGMGWNAMISVESVRYNPSTTIKDTFLYGSVITNEMKGYFGLSLYF